MIRTFDAHKIREQQELTGKLCQEEYAERSYMVATPSCFESYPDFGGYRGEAVYKTVFCAGGAGDPRNDTGPLQPSVYLYMGYPE